MEPLKASHKPVLLQSFKMENTLDLENWLANFPNQELASQISRIAGDDYIKNAEELLYNCIFAYHKAQLLFNLKPENVILLETVSTPIIGELSDTSIPTVKTRKTIYTVSFVSEFEISEPKILGFQTFK